MKLDLRNLLADESQLPSGPISCTRRASVWASMAIQADILSVPDLAGFCRFRGWYWQRRAAAYTLGQLPDDAARIVFCWEEFFDALPGEPVYQNKQQLEAFFPSFSIVNSESEPDKYDLHGSIEPGEYYELGTFDSTDEAMARVLYIADRMG